MSRIAAKSTAIAAAAALALAAPLSVAPDLSPVAVAQNTQSIDLDADASLTIDKRLGELDSETPLGGTTFRVERVQMENELNTQAGWAEASRLVAAGAANVTVTDEKYEAATDGSGKVVFSDVTVGLYRVTEIQNGNYTVAAPFLVTIPLMDQGVPNYTPTISPKNQLLEPKKSAVDTNASVGDSITYTISAPVPAGDVLRDETRTISQFRVVDKVQEDLSLKENSATITLSGVPEGVDGLVAEDYTVGYGDNTLTVEFTQVGREKLAKLRADNPGLTVQVVFAATVAKIPANGQINNTAEIFIPNAEAPLKTKPATDNDGTGNAVRTQYADVSVTKTVEGDDAGAGVGAQFSIYPCTSNNGRYTVDKDAKPVEGVNSEGTAKTGTTLTAEKGTDAAVAQGYGMQFDKETIYCAVETKAPTGFLLNPDPAPLSVSPAAGENARPLYTATINDVKDNIFGRLPATGERTMIVLLALGFVLFAGGAAYQLRRRNA